MAHLTVRVVETRAGAVRASNGGPAALLGPAGHEESSAVPGLVAGIVRATPRHTLFVRTGDQAGPLAALTLLLLLASRRRHLKNWKT
jgi:apolipoprotein N-acyltransferase